MYNSTACTFTHSNKIGAQYPRNAWKGNINSNFSVMWRNYNADWTLLIVKKYSVAYRTTVCVWHSRRLLLAGRRFEIEFSFTYNECCVVLRFYILMLTIAIFAGVVFFCYLLRLFKIVDRRKEVDTRGEWFFFILCFFLTRDENYR